MLASTVWQSETRLRGAFMRISLFRLLPDSRFECKTERDRDQARQGSTTSFRQNIDIDEIASSAAAKLKQAHRRSPKKFGL